MMGTLRANIVPGSLLSILYRVISSPQWPNEACFIHGEIQAQSAK